MKQNEFQTTTKNIFVHNFLYLNCLTISNQDSHFLLHTYIREIMNLLSPIRGHNCLERTKKGGKKHCHISYLKREIIMMTTINHEMLLNFK